MRAFSSGAHGSLIGRPDDLGVRSLNFSHAGMALLLIAVLSAGDLLGTALPLREGASPSPTGEPTPQATARGVPQSDVSGADIDRLPRYPGSIRSEYDTSVDARHRLTAVEFLVDAALDDVRTFYERAIAEHGWQRADIGFSGGEWTYLLVDGATEALVELEVSVGLVEIDLHLSEPIEPPASEGTPMPTAAPPPPPPAPAPPPPPDDDDGEGDDGSDDGDGESDG